MPTPSVRKGLYKLLSDDATLTTQLAGRIYCEHLPEKLTMPALLYTQVSGLPDMSMDGNLTGAVEGRFQIDIYADQDDQESVEAIREAIMDLASGYQSLTLDDGSTFELLSFAPIDYGRYLPDPDTRGLRYTLDVQVMFGRS